MVVTIDIAGSGPNCRPRGRRCSFSRAWTTPGCRRTLSASVAQNAPHIAGEVDDDPRPQRFAGQPGPGSAWMDRQLVLGRVADHRHHVGERTRPDHGHRTDLEDAGVAGVELQEDVVATDVSLHQPAQVVFNPLAFLIHGNWDNSTAVLIRAIGPQRTPALRQLRPAAAADSPASVSVGNRTFGPPAVLGLAVAFVDFQIERSMLIQADDLAILRPTTIAHQGIRDDQ